MNYFAYLQKKPREKKPREKKPREKKPREKKPREKKPRGRPHSPISVRATADAMAISERLLNYARELQRSGREDLMAAVERGEMTVAGAVIELHGIALPDRYGKLVQAWNRCDEDERARFLTALEEAGMVTLSQSMPE
jgi:hypothetical protein